MNRPYIYDTWMITIVIVMMVNRYVQVMALDITTIIIIIMTVTTCLLSPILLILIHININIFFIRKFICVCDSISFHFICDYRERCLQ